MVELCPNSLYRLFLHHHWLKRARKFDEMIKHILREMEQNKLDSGSGNFSSDSGSEARAGVGSEDGLGSKDE